MILFKKIQDLRLFLTQKREKGNTIGYVPTMGALHRGHISLINNSKSTNPITVSSIFINPTQFNDPKDFEKYPVTLEKDIAILEQAGCDILFLPSVAEMYPTAFNNLQRSWVPENCFRRQIQAWAFSGGLPGGTPIVANC
jgi:pantoate--beta-alanine ligase